MNIFHFRLAPHNWGTHIFLFFTLAQICRHNDCWSSLYFDRRCIFLPSGSIQEGRLCWGCRVQIGQLHLSTIGSMGMGRGHFDRIASLYFLNMTIISVWASSILAAETAFEGIDCRDICQQMPLVYWLTSSSKFPESLEFWWWWQTEVVIYKSIYRDYFWAYPLSYFSILHWQICQFAWFGLLEFC